MRFHQLPLALAATGLCASLSGEAQTPPTANPLDTLPDNMPFDVPYGAPISLDRAASAMAAAVAEAKRHDWKLNVAVVDSGANLGAFQRRGRAQPPSLALSQHKARGAATLRRRNGRAEGSDQLQ